jgi:hypothetical protein
MLKRAHITPLSLSADIFVVLASLPVGARVPPEIYIADYCDGTIPLWTVYRREEHGPLLIVTVGDDAFRHPATLFEPACCVAREVFSCATKTLAGPLYGYSGPDCISPRNPLADIRQHARVLAERGARS